MSSKKFRRGSPCDQRTLDARRACRYRVSRKIEYLMGEGIPQPKAVAMALSMERAKRLGPRGGYRASLGGRAEGPVRGAMFGGDAEVESAATAALADPTLAEEAVKEERKALSAAEQILASALNTARQGAALAAQTNSATEAQAIRENTEGTIAQQTMGLVGSGLDVAASAASATGNIPATAALTAASTGVKAVGGLVGVIAEAARMENRERASGLRALKQEYQRQGRALSSSLERLKASSLQAWRGFPPPVQPEKRGAKIDQWGRGLWGPAAWKTIVTEAKMKTPAGKWWPDAGGRFLAYIDRAKARLDDRISNNATRRAENLIDVHRESAPAVMVITASGSAGPVAQDWKNVDMAWDVLKQATSASSGALASAAQRAVVGLAFGESGFAASIVGDGMPGVDSPSRIATLDFMDAWTSAALGGCAASGCVGGPCDDLGATFTASEGGGPTQAPPEADEAIDVFAAMVSALSSAYAQLEAAPTGTAEGQRLRYRRLIQEAKALLDVFFRGARWGDGSALSADDVVGPLPPVYAGGGTRRFSQGGPFGGTTQSAVPPQAAPEGEDIVLTAASAASAASAIEAAQQIIDAAKGVQEWAFQWSLDRGGFPVLPTEPIMSQLRDVDLVSKPGSVLGGVQGFTFPRKLGGTTGAMYPGFSFIIQKVSPTDYTLTFRFQDGRERHIGRGDAQAIRATIREYKASINENLRRLGRPPISGRFGADAWMDITSPVRWGPHSEWIDDSEAIDLKGHVVYDVHGAPGLYVPEGDDDEAAEGGFSGPCDDLGAGPRGGAAYLRAAQGIVTMIRANTDDYMARRISDEVFRRRQRSYWDKANRTPVLHDLVLALLRNDTAQAQEIVQSPSAWAARRRRKGGPYAPRFGGFGAVPSPNVWGPNTVWGEYRRSDWHSFINFTEGRRNPKRYSMPAKTYEDGKRAYNRIKGFASAKNVRWSQEPSRFATIVSPEGLYGME